MTTPRCLLGLLLPLAAADAPAGEDARLSLERIFTKEEFKVKSFGPTRWLEDGSGYTTVEDSPTTKDAKDIVTYDPASGVRTVLVAAESLVPPGESKPLAIKEYAWSKDGTKLLLFTNTKRVWRLETRGDYWTFEPAPARLRKLGGDAEPSSLMFAKFSPAGDRVAYVRDHDIFVEDLADGGSIRQLTRDGSPTIINGTSDWVYEEEFNLRDAFRWNPDGTAIAFWQFDTAGVPTFTLVDYTDGRYPKLTTFPYPKVGEQNPACRLGVVAARGGDPRWVAAPGDPRDHYIPHMDWVPETCAIAFQQLNRHQNRNRVMIANVAVGEDGSIDLGAVREIFVDRDKAWVDDNDDVRWVAKGAAFTWLSERDGWRRLYLVDRAEGESTPLSPPGVDVLKVEGLDEARGWIYFGASPENVTQRYLYRTRLDGTGGAERVTPRDRPGTHTYQFSRDVSWAFHTCSTFTEPPVTELVCLPEHTTVRTLEDNAALRATIAALDPCPSEFFRVDIGGGVLLDGWRIAPHGCDRSRRYPLLIHVYGEPAGLTVLDRWGGDSHLWHLFLAQRGYAIASFDNRGTPAPRGRAWRKSIYRKVGILAAEDQARAARALLATWPVADPERVAIWGWSGGGSMTLHALLRYPELYGTGIAIAFVSDERLYDTIYQERYMGLLAENEDGYRDGSPITYADRLAGNLLLIHGTGDDNCHYQNCEVLVNAFIKHNKQFDLMAYPGRSHSIKEGENTRRHLYELMTRYLTEKVPAGPRPRGDAGGQ